MNPFYKSHQQQQQNNPFDLKAAMENMMRQIAPTGMTPEQIVRQKIANGEMSQAQFEQYSQIANQIFGRR